MPTYPTFSQKQRRKEFANKVKEFARLWKRLQWGFGNENLLFGIRRERSHHDSWRMRRGRESEVIVVILIDSHSLSLTIHSRSCHQICDAVPSGRDHSNTEFRYGPGPLWDSEKEGLNTLFTARIMQLVSEQGRKLGLDRSSEPNVPIGDFPMKGVPLRGRALSFLLQCLGSSYFALVSFPLSWLSASCLLLNSYGALFIDPSMQAFHKKMGEVPTPA